MKRYNNLILLFLVAFNAFATPSTSVSIGDHEVRVPSEYFERKLSKKVNSNKSCMLDFVENEVVGGGESKGKSKPFLKILGNFGISYEVEVKRYDPKEDIKSDVDKKVVKKVDEKIIKYAKKMGLKGKDLLDQIYKRLIGPEGIKFRDEILSDSYTGTHINYEDIYAFEEYFAIRKLNEKRRKERNLVTINKGDKSNLKIKIPDLQNLWCKKGHQKNIIDSLKKLLKTSGDDILPKEMTRLLKVLDKISNGNLDLDEKDCKICDEIRKLKYQNLKGFKLNEKTGDIYNSKNKIVTDESLKKLLFAYFYDQRFGLGPESNESNTDHIIKGTEIDSFGAGYNYEGLLKNRKFCIVERVYRDRAGAIAREKLKEKKCWDSPTSKIHQTEIFANDFYEPKDGKCPNFFGINPKTNMCERVKKCPYFERYSFDEKKCVAGIKCNEGELYANRKCIKLPKETLDSLLKTGSLCPDGKITDENFNCVPECKEGYLRENGECIRGNANKCPSNTLNFTYYDDYFKRCVRHPVCGKDSKFDEDVRDCVPYIECKDDEEQFGNKCVKIKPNCKKREYFDAAMNSCVPKLDCKNGYAQAWNKCFKDNSEEQDLNCKNDEFADYVNFKCVKKPKCENLFYDTTTNECLPKPKCKNNEKFDEANNECLKRLDCPDGLVFSEDTFFCSIKKECNEDQWYNKRNNNCEFIYKCSDDQLKSKQYFYDNNINRCRKKCNEGEYYFPGVGSGGCQRPSKCDGKWLNKHNNTCEDIVECDETSIWNSANNKCKHIYYFRVMFENSNGEQDVGCNLIIGSDNVDEDVWLDYDEYVEREEIVNICIEMYKDYFGVDFGIRH